VPGYAGLDLLQRGNELAHADLAFDRKQDQHAAPGRIADEIDVGFHSANITLFLYILILINLICIMTWHDLGQIPYADAYRHSMSSPGRFHPRPAALAAIPILVLLAGFGWALHESRPAPPSPQQRASVALTQRLGLTDLVLVTEARYLRHLALADRHSAFQDHPLALEHFPAGAVLGAPAQLLTPDPFAATNAPTIQSSSATR
jgi:hypothetical protein